MYSRQQASQLRQEFWTAFGKYMAPVLSAEGKKINWINYKTGEKDIKFVMQADNQKGSVGIELIHKDIELQQLYFGHLEQLKNFFKDSMGEEWIWMLHADDGNSKIISKIYKEKNSVSILKKEDWPALISFFKPRMIALDHFWSHTKWSFEALR